MSIRSSSAGKVRRAAILLIMAAPLSGCPHDDQVLRFTLLVDLPFAKNSMPCRTKSDVLVASSAWAGDGALSSIQAASTVTGDNVSTRFPAGTGGANPDWRQPEQGARYFDSIRQAIAFSTALYDNDDGKITASCIRPVPLQLYTLHLGENSSLMLGSGEGESLRVFPPPEGASQEATAKNDWRKYYRCKSSFECTLELPFDDPDEDGDLHRVLPPDGMRRLYILASTAANLSEVSYLHFLMQAQLVK